MERNIQKNGLVNLVAAVVIFLAAFAVDRLRRTRWPARSPRSSSASACWWRLRAGSRCGWRKTSGWKNWRWRNSPAPRASPRCLKRRMRRFSGAARPRAVREIFRAGVRRAAVPAGSRRRVAALALDRAKPPPSCRPNARWRRCRCSRIFALLLFLFGRFSVTIARLEDHRLLRPGASFLLAGAYVCFVAALAIAGVEAQISPGGFLRRARHCACCWA